MSSPAIPAEQQPSQRRRFTVDALFTDNRPQAVGVEEMPTAKEIRLDRIVPDPAQPRKQFNSFRLEELASSIALEGVLQPIVVRYDERDDIYVIVHGERRWRASRKVGASTIPAIVRDISDDRLLVQQLMENIVREDLSAIDRAFALRSLKQQLDDAPWEQVADTVGIKRSRLFQLLGTAKLPISIQDDIRSGRLSEKQSRALQGLSETRQLALRDTIVDEHLSAEAAMRISRVLKNEDIPDHVQEVALRIAEIRSTLAEKTVSQSHDPLELLQLIAAAADGDSGKRDLLAKAADAEMAAPFEGERLQSQVHGIARTLSRCTPEDLAQDPTSQKLLIALRDAISSIAPADSTSS